MRAKLSLRRSWARTARVVGYPISSSAVPRPPLAARRRCMRLTHVLLASDLNPGYLEFWPLAKRAWQEIAEIEPLLVVIGEEQSVPLSLRDDEQVRVFDPVPGVHPVFQAQCIRLLYPALLETPGAVLTSDIDMFPMNRRYFHEPVAKVDEACFVAYRDTMLRRREIPISYNAARPATWGEVFDIGTVRDIRERLVEWAGNTDYEGVRGGVGWNTDQRILYETVMAWGAVTKRLWMLDDDFCGFRRLDRVHLVDENGLEPHRRRAIRSMRYSDYTAPVPYDGDYRALTDLILRLGLEAAARTQRRRTPRVS
jgi:hypothetical protein